jgi:GMP synthase PP-ATPase subunit
MNRIFLPPAVPEDVSVSTIERAAAIASVLRECTSSDCMTGNAWRIATGSLDKMEARSIPAVRNMLW